MPTLRQSLAAQLRQTVGSSADGPPFPLGPGYFTKRSVAWSVHADFTSMMIGGTAALLTQMLHPAALAGVWDHSNFRRDSAGRLRRTAQFIAGTTYAARDHSDALIAKIRRIHDRVHGHLPDGTPYSANDPATLTWVHIAGASNFLAAYVRYRDPWLPGPAQDRYYRETAEIARALGAEDIPENRREVAAYLERVRPVLHFDERTREVSAALLGQPMANAAATQAGKLLQQAGMDLLPGWAARLHGRAPNPARKAAVAAGAHGVGAVVRWALSA